MVRLRKAQLLHGMSTTQLCPMGIPRSAHMIAKSTGLWLARLPFAAIIFFSAAVDADPQEHPALTNFMHR